MPQDKNLTQICLSGGGFGGRNGVIYARKKALTREVSKQYQQAGKKEKTGILNEMVKTTGYNRKYILHVLANWGKTTTVRISGETIRLKASPRKRKKGGGRKPLYTDEFTAALRAVWIFFRYRCGKILAPFIRSQMKYLEPAFHITPEARELLLKASPATIDRKLRADKKKLALKRTCIRAGLSCAPFSIKPINGLCSLFWTLNLPYGVTAIGEAAFVSNQLTSVTFQGTIASISRAFNGDLDNKYLAGGIGTYTLPDAYSNTWTKQ